LETVYAIGPETEKCLEETGPEKEHVLKKFIEETKLEARRKMFRVHEPVKDNIRDKLEKNPRPRKTKLSIDINGPIVEEEYEIKTKNKVGIETNPKVEGKKEMEDNKQHMEMLKQ